jgi:hypothetical protein
MTNEQNDSTFDQALLATHGTAVAAIISRALKGRTTAEGTVLVDLIARGLVDVRLLTILHPAYRIVGILHYADGVSPDEEMFEWPA